MKKRKATPRKTLFEVAIGAAWRRGDGAINTCVLATSKGAAIRAALGRSARVGTIDGKYVLFNDAGAMQIDVDVRRGCACVKGSR
jgi:hypothetical protein